MSFLVLLDKEYNRSEWSDASFSNGEFEFHHILRKMIPSSEGATIGLFIEVTLTHE